LTEHVTTIAYPAKPPLPGWLRTAGALLVGWVVAGIWMLVLYLVADAVGAIGNTHAYPHAHPSGDSVFGARSLTDWPFPDSGLWTLLANVSVVALVLVLTTLATAWSMRSAYDHFSEGRLALVLLLTGWLPLYAGPVGGFFGFLVAVCAVRFWVTRAKDRLPARNTIVTLAVLAVIAGSYGVLHPFWTMDVTTDRHATTVLVHNAAHVPVTVDGVTVSPTPSPLMRADAFTTSPFGTGERTARIPPRSERFLVLPVPQGCGTARVSVHLSYHIFGLPLTQTVPAFAKLGRPC
jgi:hypothetical protein